MRKLFKKLWVQSWYSLLRISNRVRLLPGIHRTGRVALPSYWGIKGRPTDPWLKLYLRKKIIQHLSRNVSSLRRFFWLIVIASGWYYSRIGSSIMVANRDLHLLLDLASEILETVMSSLWIISNIWNIHTRISRFQDQKTIQD